ncbi:MAG: hypothetical protein GXO43_06995 [Crenarchaeota archaeon]|nr:hypothetical protein [Thermoproteota archaeon]
MFKELIKTKLKQLAYNLVLPRTAEGLIYKPEIATLLDYIQRNAEHLWIVAETPEGYKPRIKIYLARIPNETYRYAVIILTMNKHMPHATIYFEKTLRDALQDTRTYVSVIRDDILRQVESESEKKAEEQLKRITESPEYRRIIDTVAKLTGVLPEKAEGEIRTAIQHILEDKYYEEAMREHREDLDYINSIEKEIYRIMDKLSELPVETIEPITFKKTTHII